MVFFCATFIYYHYMMSLPSRPPILFDCPATYQIIVHGRIDSGMSDLLGGMTIQIESGETDCLATTLKGELRDQSALVGVLNSLYELHLTVFSVERLDKGIPAHPGQEQVRRETEK